MLPLFEVYPRLAEWLPYIPLSILPTPVQPLRRLGAKLGLDELYIKRDDVSGAIYGGNKIRKLEFLLGDALHGKAHCVLTGGYAGSNHALATAIYARQVGLRTILALIDQPNAKYVGKNLLGGLAAGAELHHYANVSSATAGAAVCMLREKLRTGRFPYFIPAGGSSPVGVLGYVNAAFELAQQVKQGELPKPDLIYLATGTQGTAVGLQLGLRAAQLESNVMPVRVVDDRFATPTKALKLFTATNRLLHRCDPQFPLIAITADELRARADFFGGRYALFTLKGMRALHCIRELENIELDGTYTSKALAAFFADCQTASVRGKVVLFWNTYNSRALDPLTRGVEYRALPPDFHHYFEKPVQPLDC